LKEHGIRLVHTFDHPANIFGVMAAAFYRTHAVLSSSRSLRELRTPRDRRLLRVTDRFADAVVVNCDAVRRDLIEREGVPASKIRVWYNGIDVERFAGPRVKPDALADAGVVIGVVALLRPEKGLDTLVEAFGRVARRHPEARLLMVGSGSMEEQLKARVRELGLAGRCHFEPTTSDVGYWLRAIDIFVLPSRSEALSNSIMEAMVCGCAVVASRVGGNPELVREGETGLLFEVNDAAILAGRLELLMENEALRRKLAGAGQARMRNEFRTEHSIAQLEKIYEEYL
jgi:glycosyltransferase involved in cell wall biosynthesis